MGYDTFDRLCRMKGVTAYQVAKATGVSTSTLSSWKKGRYVPKGEKLKSLADYFGVSSEYLRTGETPNDIDYFYEDRRMKIIEAADDIAPGLSIIADAYIRMDMEDRQEMIEIAKMKLKKYEKKEQSAV